jgi:transglutaminase-like putative cysteine protease
MPPLTPFGQRLVWVLGCVALAMFPHISHLPAWVILLTLSSAILRLLIETRHRPLPPKWLRTAVAFAALIGVALTYRTLNGVQAGSALLIVMAGMKLLETRSVRDLTVIVFLCYFALYAAFLYNQEMLYLPYLLVAAWWLTATLMRIHQTSLGMRIGEAGRITAKMLLQALPLAALLFLFFPRLPGQFWALPARNEARSGIDDEMSPGDVSDLSLSDEVAFRVRFDGPLPPPQERYWRGPVLHEFDGRTWRRERTVFKEQTVETEGPAYRYRLALEPHQRSWVFALDMPTAWPARRVSRSADFQLTTRASDPVSVLTQFDLVSRPSYRVTGPLPRYMQQRDLSLPEARNPRAKALAREMRVLAGSDQAFIDAVLKKFRDEEYYYTLEPPRLATDSVDDFLFNTRRGFCEHFASAFTAMMRAAGIPARVVVGYQGGDFNPIGGHLVVRQSNAHAWSEVWLEGRGWVRTDPTAAVAPERIEGGLDAALSESEPVPGRLLRRSAFLSRLAYAWDAANTFWDDQVVAFGELQQRWLLEKLSFENADWKALGFALVLSLIGFFGAMSAYLAWRFRPRRRDPVAQVYHQLCRKLARRNLPRLEHEGPNDYAARISAALPHLAAQIAEIRQLYVSLRYGPSPLGSELSRLKFLVNQI